jgi:hypothetical protein
MWSCCLLGKCASLSYLGCLGGFVSYNFYHISFIEKTMCDITFRAKNLTVTSLSSELTNNLVCLGFNDGTLTVFDVRLPNNVNEVQTMHDFNAPVLGNSFAFEKTKLVGGSQDGDFAAWEPRMFRVSVEFCRLKSIYMLGSTCRVQCV